MTRRVLSALSLVLLWLSLLFALLYIGGTNALLMRRMMLTFAPPAQTGLDAGAYPRVAEMITAYLSGRAEGMQLALADGSPMFTDRELAHMADCRSLFRLDGICLLVCLSLGLALLPNLPRLPKAERRSVMIRVSGGLLGALLALGLWAAVDFSSLFIVFHRIGFRNELWLMRSTDWLIRLMPIGFFMAYSAGIALLALLPPLLILAIMRFSGQARRFPKGDWKGSGRA